MLTSIAFAILILSISTTQAETPTNQSSSIVHRKTIVNNSHHDSITHYNVETKTKDGPIENEKLPIAEKSIAKKLNPVRTPWKITKWIFKLIFALVAIIIIAVVVYCCCTRK